MRRAIQIDVYFTYFTLQTLVELRDRRKSSCDDLSLVVKTPTFSVLLALMDVVTQVSPLEGVFTALISSHLISSHLI